MSIEVTKLERESIYRDTHKITLQGESFNVKFDQLQGLFRQLAALPGILPSDANIEQVAADECQQDWNDAGYKSVYEGGYIDGAKWALNKLKGE